MPSHLTAAAPAASVAAAIGAATATAAATAAPGIGDGPERLLQLRLGLRDSESTFRFERAFGVFLVMFLPRNLPVKFAVVPWHSSIQQQTNCSRACSRVRRWGSAVRNDKRLQQHPGELTAGVLSGLIDRPD